MVMLCEDEVRRIRDIYLERIDAVVDPSERKVYSVCIGVLDLVLNE